MAGIPHDHYEPKSGGEKWLHSRLPVVGLLYDTLMIPTPKNLNWMWIWGIVLTFCLALQIITGIVLVMHYTPQADMAFASVEHIMRDVNGGHMIRYLHANGASLFFVAVYMHIFRGLYYGSYKAPREVTWIIGMLIYLAMMATAFMGYVLPWGQMSFWGATVITGLFGAIPGIGPSIQTWLLGGPAVDNATLNRFFSLHYLLALRHRGPGDGAYLGVPHHGEQQPHRCRSAPHLQGRCRKGHAALLALLRHQGPVRAGPDPRRLLRHRGVHAELPRPPRQLHRGEPALDARAYRAGMVLPALLRHPARLHVRGLGRAVRPVHHLRHHRCQVLRRARHVRRDRCTGAGTLARHVHRPLGPLPPDVQMVVRASGHRLRRPDVGRRDASRGRLHLDQPDRGDLLVCVFLHPAAAAGRDREAAAAARDDRGGFQRALRHGNAHGSAPQAAE